jgi:hypothetical protein
VSLGLKQHQLSEYDCQKQPVIDERIFSSWTYLGLGHMRFLLPTLVDFREILMCSLSTWLLHFLEWRIVLEKREGAIPPPWFMKKACQE